MRKDLKKIVRSKDNKTEKSEKYNSLREKILSEISDDFEGIFCICP